ncbi:hypothetical protein [Agrobacterium tumefaciens]|uniref:hypothetical protein n=1 Tax=Agrobacterium tumefaciens TaxID=358 RepID=UPI0009BB65B2|nr:hypothetical protein [Agrobacterium tumefaciens]
MNIKTISIEPVSGFDRDTGFRKLAKVQFFLPDLQMTIRDVVLTHDHEQGFAVAHVKPKVGQSTLQWVRNSQFAKALADAAATAYSAMLAEDLEELKALYKAAA